jgi:hypothetical protein
MHDTSTRLVERVHWFFDHHLIIAFALLVLVFLLWACVPALPHLELSISRCRSDPRALLLRAEAALRGDSPVSLEGGDLEIPCPARVCSLRGQRQTAREAVRNTRRFRFLLNFTTRTTLLLRSIGANETFPAFLIDSSPIG